MGLPVVAHKNETIVLSDGQSVDLKGLTRSQALEIAENVDSDDVSKIALMEQTLISYSAGATMQEASAWYASTPSGDVQKVIEAIMRISGLTAELGKA